MLKGLCCNWVMQFRGFLQRFKEGYCLEDSSTQHFVSLLPYF
jgi:hypothetical protein